MKLNSVAAVRAQLAHMERDLGLCELSRSQRDVFHAASLLRAGDNPVTASRLQQHPLLRGMSRATFFRSLKHLTENGYLAGEGASEEGYSLGPRLNSLQDPSCNGQY